MPSKVDSQNQTEPAHFPKQSTDAINHAKQSFKKKTTVPKAPARKPPPPPSELHSSRSSPNSNDPSIDTHIRPAASSPTMVSEISDTISTHTTKKGIKRTQTKHLDQVTLTPKLETIFVEPDTSDAPSKMYARIKKKNDIEADLKLVMIGTEYYGQHPVPIGKGAFGRVHTVTDANKNKYALKEVTIYDDECLKRMKSESHIMYTLNTPQQDHCFPKIIAAGSAKKDKKGYFFMQKVGEKALSIDITPKKNIEKLLKIEHAISNMHIKGVIHGDLKPSNIREDRSGNIWLTDFGCSKRLSQKRDFNKFEGTVIRSPNLEAITPENAKYRDLYAFGLMITELLALQQPLETAVSSFMKSKGKTSHHLKDIVKASNQIFKKSVSHPSLATIKHFLEPIANQTLPIDQAATQLSRLKVGLLTMIAPKWEKNNSHPKK